MADNKTTKGGKKNRKLGRDAHHPCHASYKAQNRARKHALLHVLRSSGWEAAKAYATAHNLAL